eukprot:1898587-Prymnesium_polylepis.1
MCIRDSALAAPPAALAGCARRRTSETVRGLVPEHATCPGGVCAQRDGASGRSCPLRGFHSI